MQTRTSRMARPAARRRYGRRVRVATGCVVVVALIVTAVVLVVSGPSSVRSPFAGTATVVPDTAWDDLFQSYGDTSGAWSGGDGAQALALPGGSTMWFFADSFLGPTDSDGTRPPLSTGLAHNSGVLYRNGALGPTYAVPTGSGYTDSGDYTWVDPPPAYPASRYELINGDQVIDRGTVYKFYQLADRDLHPAGFGYKLVGTVVESFGIDQASGGLTAAGGSPVGVEDTAGSDPVIWGAATLVSGGYIYIYGVRPYNGTASPFPLYLARVPVGGLAAGNAWQYYDGQPGCSPSASSWTDTPQLATALRTGVSAGFSVTDVDGTYVLLTGDSSSIATASDAVAYYADCPTGFSPASPEYSVFKPHLAYGYFDYEYRIVPQFSSGRDVLVSYSTDTQRVDGSCLGESFYNATIYRPRFLDVRLPGIRGPAGAPADPPIHAPPAFTAKPLQPSALRFHPLGPRDSYVSQHCRPGTPPASAPQLAVTDEGNGDVSLSWTMRPAAMWMYTIAYCDTSNTDCGADLASLSTTDPACTPAAKPNAACGFILEWANRTGALAYLLPGNTYEIQVSAANAVPDSVSSWSNVVTVTTSLARASL